MQYRVCRNISLLFIISLMAFNGLAFAENKTQNVIRLATTTSTDNSGLLGYLLPSFSEATGYKVHVIAVGTGKALRMGRDGDVDVVLVHARQAEDKFVAEGYGEKRYGVMYNDFLLVGPKDDPAEVRHSETVGQAMKQIAERRSTFVSRGDDSGTHKNELSLWKSIDIKPNGAWYREAGQGMGKVMQIAAEMDAYTLADRGTWLAYKDKLPLQAVFEGDPLLFNPYGIIGVNPQRHPDTNHDGAMALITWIISPEGQSMIGGFRIGSSQLFKPSADAGEIASVRD